MPWTSTWTGTLTSSRIDSFADLGQNAEWREPLALVAQGESSCPEGRSRRCGPTMPKTRSRAVDVKLLVRKHTARDNVHDHVDVHARRPRTEALGSRPETKAGNECAKLHAAAAS